MMITLIVRQTIYGARAVIMERRSRRLPDSWLEDRLRLIEAESVDEVMEAIAITEVRHEHA